MLEFGSDYKLKNKTWVFVHILNKRYGKINHLSRSFHQAQASYF